MTAHQPVTTAEIADLLAWARTLTHSGGADPARRAAYLTAKADLLARIASEHCDPAGHLAETTDTTPKDTR